MAGMMTSGPTPWWQTTMGKNDALGNLERSAPSGYQYDPVQMKYIRTPSSLGQDAAAMFGGMTGGGPASLQALSGSGGGVFGQGGSGASGSAAGNVARIAAPDMTSSNAATFGAAKDRAGQMARASLDALNGELGSQGMLGSGAQVQGTKDIIMDAGQFTSDVNRQNAVNDAQMKGDFAKLGYQGDITQRGQDIQHEEANAQLALAQQDRQMKMLQVMLQALGGAQSMAG